MRKSKKRVIAIITCCFIFATLCLGVFADDVNSSATVDPAMSRVGTVLTTVPFDMGDVVYDFSVNSEINVSTGYYVLECYRSDSFTTGILTIKSNTSTQYQFAAMSLNAIACTTNYQFNSDITSQIVIRDTNIAYIYVYIKNDNNNILVSNFVGSSNGYFKLHSIANRSVIDSVYSNSQDVNSSIVSVINEATNVITTNDVVMMFCILIPVISFGVGILIRLRKRV